MDVRKTVSGELLFTWKSQLLVKQIAGDSKKEGDHGDFLQVTSTVGWEKMTKRVGHPGEHQDVEAWHAPFLDSSIRMTWGSNTAVAMETRERIKANALPGPGALISTHGP